ncbi:hypothetical protein AGMMS50262_23460 [Bacteroidia bacterium]|nr:hypothetical protein AGMMS50262_23460 [Bacteroidia bacterium]
MVYGDKVTLEYYLPQEVKEMGIISIAYVVQGYRSIQLSESREIGYGGSGDCQVNVNCPAGNNWQMEKNAVALILVGGIRWCTGSLINTTANDARPYLLTANHCLNHSIHQQDSLLNEWSFYWHYESPGCANTFEPLIVSTSGAVIIAHDFAADFALIRLTEDPKNNPDITPYYLGWDRTGNPGTGGIGIHHPRGDIKKISTYTMTPQSTEYGRDTTCPHCSYWRLAWTSGTTEQGSSGSPLINNNHHVIGMLSGGHDCELRISWYGKISAAWETYFINNPSKRRLREYLDPLNTGVSILDGCAYAVTFNNQTITSGTDVISCGNITSQNVTVQNGAKLTLDATTETVIEKNFEVQLGSELEIK